MIKETIENFNSYHSRLNFTFELESDKNDKTRILVDIQTVSLIILFNKKLRSLRI